MKIFKNKKNLLKEILNKKNIAFVPTMGSIHRGHLSLIKKARKKSKNVLVSIYINPKQFSSKLDFRKYPRNINKDISLLRKTKVKYLYLPTSNDIYSFKSKVPIYLDKFSKKLCGKFRIGHFKGVINVVNRFIEIIQPYSIFLGLKDFQQLSLIKLHMDKNKIKTQVVSCPTVRAKNGIALSSRNAYLKKNQTKIAGQIYKYLNSIKSKKTSINFKKQKMSILNKLTLLGVNKIDYLECINTKTLKPIKTTNENYKIFIAYYLGNVRLIDNL
ncbi:pantoate--beta-alanine ligase [Pelagibacteraceae bacterium]|nr:pantoate--beta-alanine ligase [Pelagibacteraceae bacterium]